MSPAGVMCLYMIL
uniref:Uncharacterized protein n=1 Tax=Arundo donax TaxID=35708 RepID=A0A0A9GPK5_ARUDO